MPQLKIKKNQDQPPINHDVRLPLWVSVSMAAQLGGVVPKTIRRAITDKKIRFKVVGNRYLLDLRSLVRYLYTNTKLRNKLNENGLGQYIVKWRE